MHWPAVDRRHVSEDVAAFEFGYERYLGRPGFSIQSGAHSSINTEDRIGSLPALSRAGPIGYAGSLATSAGAQKAIQPARISVPRGSAEWWDWWWDFAPVALNGHHATSRSVPEVPAFRCLLEPRESGFEPDAHIPRVMSIRRCGVRVGVQAVSPSAKCLEEEEWWRRRESNPCPLEARCAESGRFGGASASRG